MATKLPKGLPAGLKRALTELDPGHVCVVADWFDNLKDPGALLATLRKLLGVNAADLAEAVHRLFVAAAVHVTKVLTSTGLVGYHVVVSWKAKDDNDQVKAFRSELLASVLTGNGEISEVLFNPRGCEVTELTPRHQMPAAPPFQGGRKAPVKAPRPRSVRVIKTSTTMYMPNPANEVMGQVLSSVVVKLPLSPAQTSGRPGEPFLRQAVYWLTERAIARGTGEAEALPVVAGALRQSGISVLGVVQHDRDTATENLREKLNKQRRLPEAERDAEYRQLIATLRSTSM